MTIIRVKRGTRPMAPGVTNTKVMSDSLGVSDAVVRNLMRKRVGSDSLVMFDEKVIGSAASRPLVLGTDITSGPITGGEGSNGCYLSVYGVNFGSFSDWGNTSKLKIGGVEVANYRCLVAATGDGGGANRPGNGVYETWSIQRLTVQVGALGSPTLDVAIPITIEVLGVAWTANSTSGGNLLDLDGLALTFTPCSGAIIFVDIASLGGTSNDSNAGTITSPKRHLQTKPSAFGGAVYGSGSLNGASTSSASMIQPGTHVIIRGGDYSADTNGFNDSWCDFFERTGLIGKELVVTSYPGAAGANSPEVVTYTSGTLKGGGFNFSDTSHADNSNVFGGTGYCQYIVISNMKIAGPSSHFSSSGAGGAPVNLQTHAVGARVINCDLSFPTTGYADGVVSPDTGPTAAGIAGHGTSCRRMFNWVHDVYDPSGALQNHGFYIGEHYQSDNVAARGELHTINAYNCMNRIYGGQGIMIRGAFQTETAPYCTYHHNWIQKFGKFGIEFFDEKDFGRAWCNVIVGELFTSAGTIGSQAHFAIGSDNVSATNGIWIAWNTCVGSIQHYSVLYTFAGNGGGTLRFEGNLARLTSIDATGHVGSSYLLTESSINIVLNNNNWYDASGNDTVKPSGDSTGIYADPTFTNLSGLDLTPNAASVLNGGPTTPAVTVPAFDFYFRARPQGSATKWARGAIERVGG